MSEQKKITITTGDFHTHIDAPDFKSYNEMLIVLNTAIAKVQEEAVKQARLNISNQIHNIPGPGKTH